MKTKNNTARFVKKDLIRVAIMTLAILLVPFVAMQFTSEVDWDLLDFVFMGALIFSTGLAYVLLARRITNPRYRIVIGIVLLVIFLLLWVELAVGLFD